MSNFNFNYTIYCQTRVEIFFNDIITVDLVPLEIFLKPSNEQECEEEENFF